MNDADRIAKRRAQEAQLRANAEAAATAAAAADHLTSQRRQARALMDQAVQRRAAAGYPDITNLKVEKKKLLGGWKFVDQGGYLVTRFRTPYKDTTIEIEVYLLSDGSISVSGFYRNHGPRDIMTDDYVATYLDEILEGLHRLV